MDKNKARHARTGRVVGRKRGCKVIKPVYREIVKKNERQADGLLYDVLICNHAVPANTNTYRRARMCSECTARVRHLAKTVYGVRAFVNGEPLAARR